jgi:RNA polymerase sigma factor (TIGR02999 family)
LKRLQEASRKGTLPPTRSEALDSPNRKEGVTRLIGRIQCGDVSARNELLNLVSDELYDIARFLMQAERKDHTLTATALANEAVVRLLKEAALENAQNRAHLFGILARSMRQVLVAHAKKRKSERRGGDWNRHPFDEVLEQWAGRGVADFVRFDEILHELGEIDQRQRQVIEFRFVLEFSVQVTASLLGVSERTIELDTKKARAFLFDRLRGQ